METKIKAAPLALGESTLVQHEGAVLVQTKTYLPASHLKSDNSLVTFQSFQFHMIWDIIGKTLI